MRAFKRLYWVRTSDEKLFNEKPEDNVRYRRDFEESVLAQNPYEDEFENKNIDPIIVIEEEEEEDYEGGRRGSDKRANSRQKYYQEDLSAHSNPNDSRSVQGQDRTQYYSD
jgi:hypothetical protein